MMAAIWLFGGIGELIPVIITVIVIVLSLLNQLFRGQENRPPAPKPPDRQRPPPQRKPPADLSGEIEAFLQRAQQQQQRPGEVGRAGQPAPVAVDRPPAKRAQRERKAAKPSRPARPAAADAPVVAEVVRDPIAGRPAAVSDISAFDEYGDRTLHRGELKPTEAAFAGPSETQGRDDPGALGQTALVQLLTSAESLREAIIISEILRRPEERWS